MRQTQTSSGRVNFAVQKLCDIAHRLAPVLHDATQPLHHCGPPGTDQQVVLTRCRNMNGFSFPACVQQQELL
jgi:hypothetical protein